MMYLECKDDVKARERVNEHNLLDFMFKSSTIMNAKSARYEDKYCIRKAQ